MKKMFLIFLSLSLMFCQSSFVFANEPAVSGNEVIEISDVNDLMALAEAVSSDDNGCEGSYYKLTNDIDLENASWSNYIGTYSEENASNPVLKPFKGTFDGNGHVIRNYRISCKHKLYAGLFGAVGGDAVIKNLGVENATFSIDEDWVWTTAGGVVGYLVDNAKITGCYAKNISFTVGGTFDKSKMSLSHAGALAGYVRGAAVENSYSLHTNILNSLADAGGGIAGQISDGAAVRNCYTDLYVAVSPKAGVTVENTYYPVTPPWPWNDGRDENLIYYGTQISKEELKNIAESLGGDFISDPNSVINNGYPVLSWEVDERLLPGDAQIISSSPEDGSDGVNIYNSRLSVKFDKYIDFSTLDNDGIIVEPEAEFEIENTDLSGSDTISIKFKALNLATSYNVTFRDSIKTSAGYCIASDESVSFATVSELPDNSLKNLVKNGDMEDLTNIFVFYPDNSQAASHISFAQDTELTGTVNNVLRLDPQWGDEPVVARDSITAPGTYYMSAWVKSDAEQKIALSCYAPPGLNSGWTTVSTVVEANKWTFLSCVFNVGEGAVPQEIAIRAVGSVDGSDDTIGIEVDNWSIYDISKASADDLGIIYSGLSDGDEGISPIAFETNVRFNVPIRQDSLLSGITLKAQDSTTQPVNVSFDYNDLTNCHIQFGELLPGTQYTLDFSGVMSMAGKAMTGSNITFKTVTAHGKNAAVVSSSPQNGAVSVKRSQLPIYIDFDEPIMPNSVSGIKVTPDLGAKPKVYTSNLKRCIIEIDNDKYVNGETYTVTVPQTVMTIDGYNTEAYTFSFEAVSDASLLSEINNALGDKDAVKAAISGIYDELGRKCALYNYVLDNISEKTDEFYSVFAQESKLDSIDDVCRSINSCAFKLIIGSTSDMNTVKEILLLEGSILDSGVREVYVSVLDDTNRAAIAKSAMDNKESDVDDIKDILTTEIICKSMCYVGGPAGIRNILMLTKDSFTGENDISSLLVQAEASSASSRIYGKLQGISPTSLSAIKSALKKAINEVNSSSSGSGGGGGGGSSSGISKGAGSSSGAVNFNADTAKNNTKENNVEEKVIFNDLDTVVWAENSILKLYHKGIINGREDGKFAPAETLTRAEFAKIAVLAMDGLNTAADVSFDDVSRSHWSYSYVASAYELGIINGMSDTVFGGELPVTRQDMAVILYRMAEQSGIKANNVSLGFNDYRTISDYAVEAVGHLSYLGIINGREDGRFAPKDTATRAEAAVVFDRFLSILETQKQEG
ncbi:MAG: S-layer homology domain-containing protein [Clostridiales bacterium]|nr:S-layer homology domain-containing protein [Clostridiales bacterium]